LRIRATMKMNNCTDAQSSQHTGGGNVTLLPGT